MGRAGDSAGWGAERRPCRQWRGGNVGHALCSRMDLVKGFVLQPGCGVG